MALTISVDAILVLYLNLSCVKWYADDTDSFHEDADLHGFFISAL